ncbi:MAG: flavodoxin family protein [Candidatus Nanopelagicales bacterium]
MSAVVVYESMFGSTQAVAEAVGRGLAKHLSTEVLEVGHAPLPGPGVDLLVVGGPTHAFSMSRPQTRTDAHKDSPDGRVISNGPGVREWIDSLPKQRGARAAVFDTKVLKPLTGSAAKAEGKALTAHGYDVLAHKSFGVSGKTGPLSEDELARAEAWGEQLAAQIVRH